jgi:hypothetical protein
MTTAFHFLDLIEVSRLFTGAMRTETYLIWIGAMDQTRNRRWFK